MTRDEARSILGVSPDAILAVSVGRLEAIKRPGWLLDGFAACAADCPRLQLHIVGEGPERARLRATAAAWGDRVKLPGLLPSDKLPALLAAADLFLNADHGSPAFGLSNAEALVMGSPVLATDSGAHREVVGTDGVLVPMNRHDEWLAAMRSYAGRLPESQDVRDERALRARERFSRDRMVAGYERLYGSLASGRR
ncbi:glycosyltransferase [bacterium]|nr:glycosyltransferase [bacterium]